MVVLICFTTTISDLSIYPSPGKSSDVTLSPTSPCATHITIPNLLIAEEIVFPSRVTRAIRTQVQEPAIYYHGKYVMMLGIVYVTLLQGIPRPREESYTNAAL